MFIRRNAIPLLILCAAVTSTGCRSTEEDSDRLPLAEEMERALLEGLLDRWYPTAVDSLHGGFISAFTYDFIPAENQSKMIVTQARHVWTTSRAAMRYPGRAEYLDMARHGVAFLRDAMWDKKYGGFYTLVDREGNVMDASKTAYGNAFGIYALAAYVMASEDTTALAFAREAFLWLDTHAHDTGYGGYYQHLTREGDVIRRAPEVPSTSDLGYKDQNSSIHLLEAFTELYRVWPDPRVKVRLMEMLHLIRDTITTEKGYLTLFLHPDWTPVSFRDSSHQTIEEHHNLDHVSFGHDVETAYLMLEASHVAGLHDDTLTLRIAKRMVDHALENGWDTVAGGFYDAGYYFADQKGITITRETKNWWTQAEGLNTLLLMADLFPEDPHDYYARFKEMWTYIDRNLIDHTHGEWYAGGIDTQPEMKTAMKGHIWKAAYHQYRSLENCIGRLRSHQSPM